MSAARHQTARTRAAQLPIGISLSDDIECLTNRRKAYRARVRWTDPDTGRRRSLSESHATRADAADWVAGLKRVAARGIDPNNAVVTLAEYGDSNMTLVLRGLEAKTTDPYLAGWRKRVIPTLGHVPIRMITNGAVDRAVHGWIADECSKSTVKNSLAVLVRVMEQAVRDGIISHNPARVTGWLREYARAEDELDDPRSLALPDWATLTRLADALIAASSGQYAGWGDVVISRRARPRGSVKSRAVASGTSTGRNGRGPCAGKRPLLPAEWWTRAPKASEPEQCR